MRMLDRQLEVSFKLVGGGNLPIIFIAAGDCGQPVKDLSKVCFE